MSDVALAPQPVAPRPQLPEALAAVKNLVLDSVRSPHTRRAYDRVLTGFLTWCTSGEGAAFTKATVQRYRAELEGRGFSASAINVHLAAIKKLATEAADNGLLAPELAAGIAKVPGARSEGPRAGNWLTRDQASRLLSLPDPETRKGKRDRAILGLLLACGLRRDELVRLSVEEIQLREGRWVLVDLLGKGRQRRTVPVPSWVKASIDEWITAAGVNAAACSAPSTKAAASTATASPPTSFGPSSRATRPRSVCPNWPRMICGGPARNYVEPPAGTWSRFSYS